MSEWDEKESENDPSRMLREMMDTLKGSIGPMFAKVDDGMLVRSLSGLIAATLSVRYDAATPPDLFLILDDVRATLEGGLRIVANLRSPPPLAPSDRIV